MNRRHKSLVASLLRCGALIAVFASVLLLSTARAEDETALQLINRQVEEQESALKQLSGQIKSLETDISNRNAEIKKLRGKESMLINETKQNQDQQGRLRAEITLADERIREFKSQTARRLRAMYVSSGLNAYQELLLNSGDDFERYAVYLKSISNAEERSISRLRESIRDSQLKSERLATAVVEQGKLAASLAKERGALEEKLRQLQKSKTQLSETEAAERASLASLQAQALRLETVVASFTGAEQESRPVTKSKAPPRVESSVQAPFVGQGLFRLKGSLAVPIKAQVVRRYGKSATKDFPGMVMSKGIEYKAPPGTEVKAIAPGQIMFVGRLPGYGTVIIVDHGERYYSLYGRLDQVRVAKGDIVEKSQLLATSGPSDDKGRAFYFEIRKNGNPVNPQDYIKRL